MELSPLFALALGLLVTHEIDAVRCREWRIFPGLARIADDQRAAAIFVALHAPLLALIFWALLGAGGAAAARALSAFCIVHAGLHALFLRHPRSEFNNPLSWALILGAALAGAADLALAR